MHNSNNCRIAYDCVYFLGDKPCMWHKLQQVVCKCSYFAPINGHILIIKLDAVGDVLRTTCLLPVIYKAWPGMGVTWLTRPEAVPLLENNPYIREIVPYGPDAILHVLTREFSLVINLDAGRISSGMAAIARGEAKIGYLLKNAGHVFPTNAAAEEWLRMGIFDDLKKENIKTYQRLMCEILGLPSDGIRYVLELKTSETELARRHLTELGINLEKLILGIHTGGGGRWKHKQWREDGFLGLINDLLQECQTEFQILLFGGPLERDLNQRIGNNVKVPVFDAGCDNDLRHFAALIGQCSVVLSGDTLAMHVALATGRRLVVLFGPTSSAEIELFGLGEKVFPDLDCLCCYKTVCDCSPNCMELISIEMVKSAIMRQKNILQT